MGRAWRGVAGGRGEILVALGCALAVFCLYFATMPRGLGPPAAPGAWQVPEDDVALRTVLPILGTPNQPGYSAYWAVWQLFSWADAPRGLRLHLLSAASAAVAVAALAILLLQISIGRVATVAAALGFGFGLEVWNAATQAGPASLQAALIGSALVALIEGRRGGSPGPSAVAAVLLGAAVGVHASAFVFVPAAVWYAARAGGSWRRPAAAMVAGLGAAGLVQYWWAVRSAWARTPGTEVDLAASVGLAWRTLAGAQPAGEIVERLAAAAALLNAELTILGAVLAAVGVVCLLRRRRSEDLLVLAGLGLAVVGISLWRLREPLLLLAPLALMAWVAVGAGADWVVRRAPGGRAALTLLVLWLPVSEVLHLDVRDRSDQQLYDWVVRRVDDLVADGAVLMAEAPELDRLLWLGLDTTIQIRPPDPAAIRASWESGTPVYGFGGSRAALEPVGARFRPTALSGIPLVDYVRFLPEDSIVAVAAGVGFGAHVTPAGPVPLEAAGGAAQLFGRPAAAYAAIGVRGAADALESLGEDAAGVAVRFGEPVGGAGIVSPADVEAVASGTAAAILVNGRRLVETRRGAALVALSASGERLDVRALEPARRFEVPLGEQWPLELEQLDEWASCLEARSGGWSEASWPEGTRALRIEPRVSTRSTLTLQLSSDGPLEPALPAGAAAAIEGPASGGRLEISLAPGGVQALDLGGRARGATGRLEPGGGGVALVCPAPVRPIELFRYQTALPESIPVADDRWFGSGWHAAEYAGDEPYRWSSDPDGQIFVWLERPAEIRIELDAMAVDVGAGRQPIGLSVNGVALAAGAAAAPGRHSWIVPEDVWLAGLNELRLHVDRLVVPADAGLGADVRSLGLRLSRLVLAVR